MQKQHSARTSLIEASFIAWCLLLHEGNTVIADQCQQMWYYVSYADAK